MRDDYEVLYDNEEFDDEENLKTFMVTVTVTMIVGAGSEEEAEDVITDLLYSNSYTHEIDDIEVEEI